MSNGGHVRMSSDIREDGALVDVERPPFTQEEADILDSLVAGRGVLMNANVGFGVKISGTHDGRISIDVDPAGNFWRKRSVFHSLFLLWGGCDRPALDGFELTNHSRVASMTAGRSMDTRFGLYTKPTERPELGPGRLGIGLGYCHVPPPCAGSTGVLVVPPPAGR